MPADFPDEPVLETRPPLGLPLAVTWCAILARIKAIAEARPGPEVRGA